PRRKVESGLTNVPFKAARDSGAATLSPTASAPRQLPGEGPPGGATETLLQRLVGRLRVEVVVEWQRPPRRAVLARVVLLQPGVALGQAEGHQRHHRRLVEGDGQIP